MLKVLWDALKFSQVFWSSNDGRFLDQWWPLIWRNCSYMHCFTIPVLYSSKMILDYYHETSSKLLMEKIKFESILYLVSHFWIYQMSPSLNCIAPFVAKNQSYRSSTTFSRKLWLSYDEIMTKFLLRGVLQLSLEGTSYGGQTENLFDIQSGS